MMSRARMSPSFSSQTDSMKTTKPTINGSALSARTFKAQESQPVRSRPRVPGGAPAWSMSPLMEVLPGSPPPVGSSGSSPISPLSSKTCSLKSEGFFSPTNASTPRNQDGMENAKEFGRLCLTNLQNNPHKGSCLSKLAMGETAFSEPQHEFLRGQSNTEQESSVYEDFSHMARAEQSANEESDVKKQKLRAEVEAWKKAEHMKLMTKLRREEAAIEEWEFKQTSKALEQIKSLRTNWRSNSVRCNAPISERQRSLK
ncbi:hypothetical protein M0R45_034836 [Rubus argutus]|uniref:Remorin C-terminal domain-containing protein n=1 Tax=Rubus argutus TaxID=59490 RepID=A0AAW1VWQ3_RUBAR